MDKHNLLETEKYMRHFISKYFGIIIASRSGIKCYNQSKLISSSNDWFNLILKDEAVIEADIKSVWDGSTQSILKSPIVLEIEVKNNSDEKSTLLEMWSISCDDTDLQPNKPNNVYFKMSTLLKTLLTLTRVLPAYHVTQNTIPLFRFSTNYRFSRSKNSDLSLNEFTFGVIKTMSANLTLQVHYKSYNLHSCLNSISQVLGLANANENSIKSNNLELNGDNLDSSYLDARSLQPMSETSSTSMSNNDVYISNCQLPDLSGKESKEVRIAENMPTDLNFFYKECKDAFQLNIFESAESSGDIKSMFNMITEQIAEFEINAKQFDNFFQSINK